MDSKKDFYNNYIRYCHTYRFLKRFLKRKDTDLDELAHHYTLIDLHLTEKVDAPIEKLQEEIRGLISSKITVVNKVLKDISANIEELRSRNRTKDLIIKTSFWIPRKYREAIVGDIMEDCHELRVLGKSEWRIRIHVIWQLAIALILLRPTALVDAFKRIWSMK